MRFAVLSDIHANGPALGAALAAIPADLPIWLLGDVVGYYPDVAEVLERLDGLSRAGRLPIWLRGNHDAAALGGRLSAYDLNGAARVAIEQTRAMLTPGQRALLEQTLVGPIVAEGGHPIMLVHGGPDDPLEHYMRGEYDAERAAPHCQTRLCLVGHTHVPLKLASDAPERSGSWRRQALFQVAENRFRYDEPMVFLNPGSVGQPRDGFHMPDGRPHAAYAILDTVAGTFTVHRVGYDAGPLLDRTCAWLAGQLSEADLKPYVERLLHSV